MAKTEDFEPGAHLILDVLGSLVYELNKCASTPSPSNTASRSKQLEICRGYVKHKEDCSTSLESFPTKHIDQEQVELQKIYNDKKQAPLITRKLKKPPHQRISWVKS